MLKVPDNLFCELVSATSTPQVSLGSLQIPKEFTSADLTTTLASLTESEPKPLQGPFRFFVNGKLLQSDLASHMSKYAIHGEKKIRILFEEGMTVPRIGNRIEFKDWVREIGCVHDKTSPFTIVGLFSGRLAILDKNMTQLGIVDKGTRPFHPLTTGPKDEPLDSQLFRFLPHRHSTEASDFMSFSADYHGDLSVFEHSVGLGTDDWQHRSSLVYTFENQCRVTALSMNPGNQDQLILGDIEGNLKLVQMSDSGKSEDAQWSLRLNTLVGNDNLTSFKSVNDLKWSSESSIVGLGNDNSVSLVEPSSLQPILRINTQFSTPLVCALRENSAKCTLVGFEDGYLRLFDLRSNQKKAQSLYKSHSQMVSSLDFNKVDGNLFVSGGVDGLVKVWDMRSDRPLYSVKVAENSKIFCVRWTSKTTFN